MSDAPKEGGMLGAGGGWGGGGGGPWDGMVGVVDLVERVGDVVKRGGAAVVPLRCVGGRGKVILEVEVRVFSQQGIRFVVIGSLWDGSYLWWEFCYF